MYRKRCRLISVLIGAGILLWCATSLAQQGGQPSRDPRLTKFLAAFKATEASLELSDHFHNFWSKEWLGPESPWSPYLDRPFTDGLDAGEQAQWSTAQAEGRCSKFSELEKRGFLNLYPFLRTAFEVVHVQLVFSVGVVANLSLRSRRCEALRRLNRARRELAQRNATPLLLSTSQIRTTSFSKDFNDEALRKRCDAYQSLYEFAYFEDFLLAQRDLLKLTGATARFVFSPAEAYYLLQRLRHRRPSTAVSDERLERTGALIDAATRKRLERAAHEGDIEAAKSPRWGCPMGLPEE